MDIDIFSDTVCPWCFIGKRRLEKALAERPDTEVTVRWHAFQLNPDMPDAGMDRRQYLETKFGGKENAKRVYDTIAAAGEKEGIAFNFKDIPNTPNTVDSHRLVRVAEDYEKQDAVVQALFDAYFLEGRDIGEREVLLDAAEAAGLDRAEIDRFLAGDQYREEVLAEDQMARQHGIQGVPCFIFNGRYAVSGAQEPEVFLKIMDVLEQEEDPQPAA